MDNLIIRKIAEEKASWRQIGRLMESDDLKDVLEVGNVIPIRLTDGRILNAVAAEVTSSGATFVSLDSELCHEMYSGEKKMTVYGWMNAEIRDVLHNSFLKLFPAEVMNLMVSKRIRQRVAGNAVIEEANDYLWIPSFTELFGTDGDGKPYPTDGAEEYHLPLFDTERARVKLYGNGTCEYWTRTPMSKDDTHRVINEFNDDVPQFVTVTAAGWRGNRLPFKPVAFPVAFQIGRKANRNRDQLNRNRQERQNISANEYQKEAMKFASDISRATDNNLLLQGVMGMCGEAGECIDIVKKIVFHGHQFDEKTREHLAKEIGDVQWYVATAAEAIGYPLEEIMLMNIKKLSARYGKHFTTEASMYRKEGDI